VAVLWTFRDHSSGRVENELKTILFEIGEGSEKRVAVIEFSVCERCGDSVRSGVVKSVHYSIILVLDLST